MTRSEHWDRVYSSKTASEVSWYQPSLATSLELITAAGLPVDAPILDAGGGNSSLVDDLLDRGFEKINVADVSAVAIHGSRQRLGERADRVTWILGDLTKLSLRPRQFRLWHDRAVFHFLTEPADRRAYIDSLLRSLVPDGHVVMATFSLSGPLRCSGLDVVRYDPDTLHEQVGDQFELVRALHDTHTTPSGKSQNFLFCHFRRTSRSAAKERS